MIFCEQTTQPKGLFENPKKTIYLSAVEPIFK